MDTLTLGRRESPVSELLTLRVFADLGISKMGILDKPGQRSFVTSETGRFIRRLALGSEF